MAFTKLTEYEYVALAADVKTTVGVTIGARLLEVDTDIEWIFDGTAWHEIERVIKQTAHKQIQLGFMWDVSTLFIEVANDANADLIFEVGSIESHTVFTVQTEGGAHGFIYEEPTVTAATGITAIIKNANRTTGDSGAPVALQGPTITDLGTLIFEWFIPGGSGGNANGGDASRDSELVLKANTKYLFRLTNKKGNAADMSIALHTYEHD